MSIKKLFSKQIRLNSHFYQSDVLTYIESAMKECSSFKMFFDTKQNGNQELNMNIDGKYNIVFKMTSDEYFSKVCNVNPETLPLEKPTINYLNNKTVIISIKERHHSDMFNHFKNKAETTQVLYI